VPDGSPADASFIVVHQAAAALRELQGMSIEEAFRFLYSADEAMRADVAELARRVVETPHAWSDRRPS
jgi:hypothetical protein